MGLLTGLCIGPLPALLRLLTQLMALHANYNSACLLRLNVCNDLANHEGVGRKKNGRTGAGVVMVAGATGSCLREVGHYFLLA